MVTSQQAGHHHIGIGAASSVPAPQSSDADACAVAAWGYNAQGLPEWKWSDIGIRTEYNWNADGSLQGIIDSTDNGANVSAHSYTYDAFGAQSVHDFGLPRNVMRDHYTRTALGQLKQWSRQVILPTLGNDVLKESYRYDAFGNRTRLSYGADGGNGVTDMDFTHDDAQGNTDAVTQDWQLGRRAASGFARFSGAAHG